MRTEMALKLMEERNNKITGEQKKDIHERDGAYLEKSHANACNIAEKVWMERDKMYRWR